MIEIKKLSKSNKNFSIKVFIFFMIFAILILATIIIVHIEFSKEQQLKKFIHESSLQAKEKLIFLGEFMQKRADSLLAVSYNPYFREYISNNLYPFNTDFLFYTIMQENKEYMQLRFIDKDGIEKLRFDRHFYGESPFKVGRLQNKQKRYYFQKTKSLKEGEIFFSKIDFNIENGIVQKPYIPVVRVATPVYIHNKFKGIIIVNIFVERFMELFTSSPIYNIYLANQDGYLIKYENQFYDWINKTKHIYSIYGKELSDKIIDTKNQKVIFDKNIFVSKTNIGNQNILIIYNSKMQTLKDLRQEDINMALIILAISIFISIPFAYLLSRPLNNMFDVVVQQSNKLHDLATTLDKKVEIETLKNAKKDRLLQHRSKMSELGDMIGNIAHQWRHPLTRLSLLLQNLKAYKNKNKMTDDIFFDTLNKVDYQIEFMSNTIDNFKDFYKTDQNKEDFVIKDSLDDILKIIGSTLEHENIKINITDYDHYKINGNKNQFSQVMLNLIINAKDALRENKIDGPEINIHIHKYNNHCQIDVEDNAGGINKNIINDIFDPYFTTKKDKGTGIGLYLCKTIIEEEMHGKLKVKNTSEGAKFTIFI